MAEQWVSCAEAIRILAQLYDESDRYAEYEISVSVATDTLLKRLANGALRAQTFKGQMSSGDPLGKEKVTDFENQILPASFWWTLIECDDNRRELDWIVGDFSYFMGSGEHCLSGKAFNVYFDASGLPGASIAKAESIALSGEAKGAGRPARFDWPEAVLAIFGLIYRGELKPQNQADIERALLLHLSNGESAPSESTARPYAKKIWAEYLKA